MKQGILMMTLGGVLAAGLGQAQAANGADALQPVDLRKVTVGGELGRREMQWWWQRPAG